MGDEQKIFLLEQDLKANILTLGFRKEGSKLLLEMKIKDLKADKDYDYTQVFAWA